MAIGVAWRGSSGIKIMKGSSGGSSISNGVAKAASS